jgi:hypothetical protein
MMTLSPRIARTLADKYRYAMGGLSGRPSAPQRSGHTMVIHTTAMQQGRGGMNFSSHYWYLVSLLRWYGLQRLCLQEDRNRVSKYLKHYGKGYDVCTIALDRSPGPGAVDAP